MRDFDETTITEAVLARFAATPDPRLREVMQALVRHLHGFVREVEPTMAEWEAAIAFLTATGQKCDDKRQEFILLSDTLGVSMLVDAINNRLPAGATPSTVLGPFHVQGAVEKPLGVTLAAGAAGEPMRVEGRVTSADGTPLPGAELDIWHSDADGLYDVQHQGEPPELRARFRTDAEGRFHFTSIAPTAYPVPTDGPVGAMLEATGRHPMRPAHVHFMISAPGHRTLVTHVFAAGDSYLDSDAVFGVKDALVREWARDADGVRALRYDFALAPLT